MKTSTEKRLENITKISNNIDNTMELSRPLAKMMLPIKKDLDLAGVSFYNREITLSKSLWEKQYKAGIVRCLGINIIWQ